MSESSGSASGSSAATTQKCVHHYVMVQGGMRCKKCGRKL